MIKIETERLFLYPISDEEMQTVIDTEKDPEMKKAYSEMLQGCLDNPKDRVWFATWNIGLKDGYCGNGYMTEAVRAMTEWANSQNKVSRVEAETDPDNKPSMNVLTKVGFIPNGETGEEGPRFVLAKKRTQI